MGNSMKKCAGLVPEDHNHHTHRSSGRSYHHSSYHNNTHMNSTAVNIAVMSASCGGYSGSGGCGF